MLYTTKASSQQFTLLPTHQSLHVYLSSPLARLVPGSQSTQPLADLSKYLPLPAAGRMHSLRGQLGSSLTLLP